jgi:hypothetical protein
MSDRPAPEPLMKSVSVSGDGITAVLTDGRTISVPRDVRLECGYRIDMLAEKTIVVRRILLDP